MAGGSRYSLNKSKYLLDPEKERLVYLLKSHLRADSRNCLLLFLALHTGARALELLNLRTEDLDDHGETVYIKGMKGSNDREIPLPPWLYESLSGYLRQNFAKKSADITHPSLSRRAYMHCSHLEDSPPSGRVFNISYNRLRQIWQLYRPVPKKFHSLRHTFAIHLYKKTKDLRLVQVALGHRNITNTMIYADYVYSQQELRKLIL